MKKYLKLALVSVMLMSFAAFAAFAAPLMAQTVTEIEADEPETAVRGQRELIDPALLEEVVTVEYAIQRGETFIFENVSIVAQTISKINETVDYAVYYSDGSLYLAQSDSYVNELVVPAGGWAVITSIDYTYEYLSVSVPDAFFLVEQTETPAFEKVKLGMSDTYLFTNASNISQNLYKSHSSCDYIMYDAAGNITSYKNDNYAESYTVPAGYTIKITSIGSSETRINALSGKFNIAQSTTPVMKTLRPIVGDTYTFTNKANVKYRLFVGWSPINYVICDTNGVETESGAEQYKEYFDIPAGYSVKITFVGDSHVSALYDKFDVQKNDEIVFNRIGVSTGETYSFKNITEAEKTIPVSWSPVDYAIYDAEGNISSYGIERWVENIQVPADHTLRVTLRGDTHFWIREEFFEVNKEIQKVTETVYGSGGESYVFTNNTQAEQKIYSWWGPVDYIVYYSNGKVKETRNDQYIENLSIPAGGSVKVTCRSEQRFIFLKDLVTFVCSNSPKKYKVSNLDTVEMPLCFNNGESYDYVMYDADDTFVEVDFNQTEQLNIPGNGYIYVTVYTPFAEPFENAADFEVTAVNEDMFETTWLQDGETYSFTNNSTRELDVFCKGWVCDYIIYNADGSIEKYAPNEYSEHYTVPIGGSVYITAGDTMYIKTLKDSFDVQEQDEDIFTKMVFKHGETYIFKNSSPRVEEFFSDTSNSAIDYTLYKADASLYSFGVAEQFTSMSIVGGSSLAITPLIGDKQYYLLNGVFTDVSTRSFPAVKRIYIEGNTSSEIVNASENDEMLYFVNPEEADYSTFDENGNVQEAQELTRFYELTVPSKGSAEITSRLSTIALCGVYEYFSGEDLSVPVTGITLSSSNLSLTKGKQKLLSATVTPDDATNKNVVWSSSDATIVTVAQTGKITAKGVGTATVTATTEDGGFSASCTVTVTDHAAQTVAVTGVTLNKTSIELNVGETSILTAAVAPANATNQSVTWSSSNSEVATVANGVVTAKAAGEAVIIVTTADGGKTATCIVKVAQEQPDIKIYNVSYDANGGSGAPSSQVKTEGVALRLSTQYPVREGYNFLGWATSANGNAKYAPGSSYTEDANVTLYAVWKEIEEDPDDVIDPNGPKVTASTVTSLAGKQVKVSLNLENNPGIAGLKVMVAYDSALILNTVEQGSALSSLTIIPPENVTDNPASIVWFAINDDTSNGCIAILTFTIAEGTPEGEYKIDISVGNDDATNADLEVIKVYAVDGAVNVIDVIMGDVLSDGKINIQDVILLAQYCAGWQSAINRADIAAADVKADGKVNIQDVILLAQYCAGWHVTLG